MDKLLSIYKELGFNNDNVLSLAIDIFDEYTKKGRADILIISKTGENELLFYTTRNCIQNNIIIDEDGDVEFMCIPIDVRKTYNEFYEYNTCDAYYLSCKL